jgi:Na+-transporting methylmalonyl-CoA/oxaloacetate decarboxylase gamma subunit
MLLNIIGSTLKIMSIGMTTVFAVLLIFFIVVKALQAIFPEKE